jgi:hypothetical protein
MECFKDGRFLRFIQVGLMNEEHSHRETLDRIDREIEALLRAGRLSPLRYDLEFSQLAKANRAANLKALLTARRHYHELWQDASS